MQKPLALSLPSKVVIQKRCHIPGEGADIDGATIKALKDTGEVTVSASPLTSPIWALQKTD